LWVLFGSVCGRSFALFAEPVERKDTLNTEYSILLPSDLEIRVSFALV